jgi:hypothetical protein
MRIRGLGLIFLAVSVVPVSAQVTVQITQDQDQFLPGEALPVAVRITNRSGQTLRLGDDPEWLTFTVETRDGRAVAKLSDPQVTGAFALESSMVAIKRVDLAPYFSLSEQGRYVVTATVHVPGWDRDFTSPQQRFNLTEGTKLTELEVGLPPAAGSSNSLPEVRKYILQQANYLKGQIRLYLRVMDSYGKTFRVFAIGPMVSFGRPDPQVDKFSNLHVLYQYGPSSYSYTVFNPQGELLVRQTYEYANSRPRLRVGDDGLVSVHGGVRRPASNDVPSSEPPSPDSEDDAKGTPPADHPDTAKPKSDTKQQ